MVSSVLSSLVCVLCVILLPAVWADDCGEKTKRLTEESQERCSGSNEKIKGDEFLSSNLYFILPIIFFVVLIICGVVTCCLLYKKCRKGRNQGHQAFTTVVNTPLQPVSPYGYLFYPGYQPGYGGPVVPTAPPPSYFEANDPAHSPAAFGPGHPMYPYPSEPYVPDSDPHAQLPYNPSYGSNL